MTRGPVAVIRPAALLQNLARVRQAAPGCRTLAVIKANAYGHGLVPVARILQDADAFAVARLSEAAQLRDAGVTKRIVVLGGCSDAAEVREATALGLDVVVHAADQVALLERLSDRLPPNAWLKLDSGMGRLGLSAAEFPEALARLRRIYGGPERIVLMTHLASADDRADPATPAQLARLAAVLDDWPGDVSVANSAAILGWPDALRQSAQLRYRGANWVRPGLMLYGVSPLPGVSAAALGLRPAMSFEASLMAVKTVPAGTKVGYAGTWTAPRRTRLAVAAAGYADGYPWQLPSGTPIQVRGRLAPVIGRISMDMVTIDVTDMPEAGPGDRVVLWGDEPTVGELAALAGTIPYTLVTGVNRRVLVHVDGGEGDAASL